MIRLLIRNICSPVCALLLCCIVGSSQPAAAQPPVLEAAMSPAQSIWTLEPQFSNQEVRFSLRVRREGYLNRFGAFDYYCRVRVERPGGAEVWNNRHGFDEQGYAEQRFSFPGFFLDRSASRAAPSFGRWKVRLFVEDRDGRNGLLAREFLLDFRDGRTASASTAAKDGVTRAYPVPASGYRDWKLQDWGVGIYDELPGRSGMITVESRKSFSLRGIRAAWNQGHRFGVWLSGPALSGSQNRAGKPPYLFGYILHGPGNRADGLKPKQRRSLSADRSGSVVVPLEPDRPGSYRLIWLIREQGSDAARESSWKRIGSLSFTLTE